MARARRYAITMNSDQLDLLEDILAYYRMSGFGGGDHSNRDDQRLIGRLENQVERRRMRAAEDQVEDEMLAKYGVDHD